MTEFKLDFYNVARCGYFRRGHREAEFGDLVTMLNQFQAWVNDLKLGETRNQDPDLERNIMPTYCFDFRHDQYTNDYFMITWNETQSDEGLVSSVNTNDQVGQVDVESTELPEDNIPGYATYFWFVSEENILVSCRPKGMAYNGHQNLRRYLNNYLEGYTPHVIFDEQGPDRILGYSADGQYREGIPHVYSKFETFLKSHNTDIEFLYANRERIRKVVKKSSLHFDAPDDRNIYERILEILHVIPTDGHNYDNHSYNVKLDLQPTQNDLSAIIEGWENDNVSSDVGFFFTNEVSPIWLSKTYNKYETILNINRREGDVFDSSTLFRLLLEERPAILNSL